MIDIEEQMVSYARICWDAYNAIANLQVEENVLAHNKLNFDPDHWFHYYFY